MNKKVDKEKAISMYENGDTILEISKYFDVTYTRIYQIVKKIITKNITNKSVSKSINNSRKKCIDVLGGKCVKCGFNDIRALQIDHVNGGGLKESRKIGNYKMYLNIINDETIRCNYQILCANCNWIKRYENKEVRNGVLHFEYKIESDNEEQE